MNIYCHINIAARRNSADRFTVRYTWCYVNATFGPSSPHVVLSPVHSGLAAENGLFPNRELHICIAAASTRPLGSRPCTNQGYAQVPKSKEQTRESSSDTRELFKLFLYVSLPTRCFKCAPYQVILKLYHPS